MQVVCLTAKAVTSKRSGPTDALEQGDEHAGDGFGNDGEGGHDTIYANRVVGLQYMMHEWGLVRNAWGSHSCATWPVIFAARSSSTLTGRGGLPGF